MKILVATHQTQGQRNSDFCFCEEGEFVLFGPVCNRDENDIDGPCGCRRSMEGWSNGSTTTFMVASTTLSKRQYLRLFVRARDRANAGAWFLSEPLNTKLAKATPRVDNLLSIANAFPVGTILERRRDEILIRVKALQHNKNEPTLEKYSNLQKSREPIDDILGEMIKQVF